MSQFVVDRAAQKWWLRLLLPCVGFVGFLVLWVIVSANSTPFQFPSPLAVLQVMFGGFFSSEVIQAQGGGSHGFSTNLAATVVRTLSAVVVGAAAGSVLGFVLARMPTIRMIFQPPIEVLRLVPGLIAVPFLVLWFGIGPGPQLFLIVAYTLLVLQLSVYFAVRNFPPNLLANAQTLGAHGWALTRSVIIPGILPEVLGSLRVTLQLSWGLAVIAELLGAQTGIGRVMESMSSISRVDYILAAVAWLTVAAVFFDLLFRALIRRFVAWAQ
jgi:ABC-type nitrate/sulfonate/bicarbonate transport system permease component